MIRVIALITAGFLFFASLEAWAGYWLLGRWYVSSRYASLTLGKVKQWMDRGIITSTTQTAKVFINRNGKWILITLGLSQVTSELQQRLQSSMACYVLAPGEHFWLAVRQNGQVDCFCGGFTNKIRQYFSATSNCPYAAYNRYSYHGTGMVYIYEWDPSGNRWQRVAHIPAWGEYVVSKDNITCYYRVQQKVFNVCDFSRAPSREWENERRRVPVRAFPNVNDFLRPDVIEGDSSLRWLRDEYQRIANDPSIPTIPADLLNGVDLPSIDWSASPDEALDEVAESSRDLSREGEGSRDAVDIPGLDTNLPSIERKPFPVELINSLVQNHPLLRILQGITFDAGSGGSCVIGSGLFTIEFCDHAWILNLMGAIIVPVAFIAGLLGWRTD